MKRYSQVCKSSFANSSRHVLVCMFVAAVAVLSGLTAMADVKGPQRAGDINRADPDRPKADFVPGEILVGFQPGAAGRADQVRNAIGAQKIKEWPGVQAQHWKLPPGLDVARAVEVLSRNPNVLYAEPNYVYEAAEFPSDPPSDPLRGELWGLHNVGQTGGTVGADIGALAAWAKQTGSQSVVVAVIDSGIDYNHPDLNANIWINPGEIPGNGIDDDGNGYIDDVIGWDFVNNDNDPMDDNGHGTHVAGTIGGSGNNGVGVIGVSPVVRLMPLKFLGAGGSGSTADAISAVLYAASFKDASGNPVVRISNNSWGGGGKSKALENAIKNCGALFCAAAGNSGSSSVMYPAGYRLANIVAVAATDHNDLLAYFSNYGSWVHLAAPGVTTLSTIPGTTYGVKSGTSMATPHVAGALALLQAELPLWDNAALKAHLLATVDSKASLSGKVTSGGRLNVANALGAAPLPPDTVPPNPVSDLALAGEPAQNSVTLSWTASGDDGNEGLAYLYDLRYASTPITPDDWNSATPVIGEPLPQAAGTTEYLAVDGLRAGTTYYFAVRVIDEMGNASELSNVLEASTAASEWTVEFVDSTAGDYNSLAYNFAGQPVIAYNSQGNIKLATRTDAGWTSETVAPGRAGVSLAYNSSGTPTVSWGGAASKGKNSIVYYAERSAGAWNVTAVESGSVQTEKTSLAYGLGGQPAISYRTFNGSGAGLKLAWRQGATWKTQTAHPNAGARYNSLAFSPDGNPFIAYSHDVDGDGWLDSLMLAEGVWNGSTYNWSITTLETGVVGYGVFANVAFDPEGNPIITHGNAGKIRLVRRIAGEWFVEVIDAGRYPFMTVDGAGNVHVAHAAASTYSLAVASAPLDGSTPWTFSIADDDAFIFWPGAICVGAGDLPAISYRNWGLQFAKKNPGL